MSQQNKPDIFTRFASHVSAWLGRPWLFAIMLCLVIIWLVSGPIFGFSDTWQLLINTSTTIITFLMVFIIQNTQNRDNLAMNIKLDAIMKKLGIDEDDLLTAEDKSDKILEREKQKAQHTKKQKAKK